MFVNFVCFFEIDDWLLWIAEVLLEYLLGDFDGDFPMFLKRLIGGVLGF